MIEINFGIDPGKKGGLGLLISGPAQSERMAWPFSEENLFEAISVIEKWTLPEYRPYTLKTCLEKVGAMPGQGVTSMFTFGRSFGFIEGVLRTSNIPFQLVPPQKWKKEFSLSTDKNKSIEVCKRLFPEIVLRATPRCTTDHDGMAEALLLAEYARRKL